MARREVLDDPVIDVFRALSEPIRVDIMTRILNTKELACTTLETELPVGKSTISYHMKILRRAGLVTIRKEGTYYFYTPRRQAIRELMPGLLKWLGARELSVDNGRRRSAERRRPRTAAVK